MRRRLWIDAIRRQDTNGKHWEAADHDRVCHLRFVTGNQNNPKQRKAKHFRAEKRESERGYHEVASALLDLSSLENISQPDLDSNLPDPSSLHDDCLKKIAGLQVENRQLYSELERPQSENKVL
uniref:Uncharacterized protein n=1 Tax=Magallana gigas TaxID=29159 RepID=A0A8W8NJ62_MAGGI